MAKPRLKRWDSYTGRYVTLDPREAEDIGQSTMEGFAVPTEHTEETCAKCHDAPVNAAWNVFCDECLDLNLGFV